MTILDGFRFTLGVMLAVVTIGLASSFALAVGAFILLVFRRR